MAKRQIAFVHGGDTFPDQESFLAFLKTAVPREPFWSPDASPRWRETLARRFSDRCEIMMPSMPNKQSARYDEWSLWFESHIPFLRDGVILVGHSLGGIFLAKYLSERTLPVRIDALALVAAPFDDETNESLGDFILSEDLGKVSKQSGTIILYHSEDDPVVPFTELAKYARAFPDAEAITLGGRGHFLDSDFPELSERIKNIIESD
ncbi:MAG: alpha/beta hydrolase [Candidatus Moraniibacteriota bacterium]